MNLSKNNLSDKSTIYLYPFLKETLNLYELYLHWNNISADGGVLLAHALELNNFLAVLDLSNNNLGTRLLPPPRKPGFLSRFWHFREIPRFSFTGVSGVSGIFIYMKDIYILSNLKIDL